MTFISSQGTKKYKRWFINVTPTLISKMLLVSKLTLVVVLSLTTIVVSTNQIVSGTCGCPMERLDSFHEERIPAWITEWICYQPGASCGTGIERAPVSSVSIHSFLSMHVFSLVWIQCQQLIGRLEVGYTRKIGDVEKVVHRRNITVSTGCLCMPVDMQSFRQTESILRL